MSGNAQTVGPASVRSRLDGAFDAYISIDERGTITDWNDAAERLFGWSRTEIVGKNLAETLIPARYRQCQERGIALFREAGHGPVVNQRVEFNALHRDGNEIPVEITLWPEYSDGTWSFNAFVRDLHDRNEVDNLRSLLASVVESSNDAIVTKTLDGVITSWNAAAERLMGYRPHEVIGHSILTLVPSELHQEEYAILARLREGRRIEHFETTRVSKSGRRLQVDLTISPIHNRQSEVIGASKIMRDVTERNLLDATSQALASNLNLKDLLQAVIDVATQLSGAECGVFMCNLTDFSGDAYRLVSVSGMPPHGVESVFGAQTDPVFVAAFDEGLPIRIDDLSEDGGLAGLRSRLAAIEADVKVRSYMAIPVVSRTGRVFGGLFFTHAEPARFSSPNQSMIVSLARHASIAIDNAQLFEERNALLASERALRNEAERLSAIKDDFLAVLSHELRTPLNAMLGWTQILRLGVIDENELQVGLEVIERNVVAQTRLIDDLLDVSRIVSGRMRLELLEIMPATLVETVIESLRPDARTREVSMHARLDHSVGPVSADPTRLQQVISNLMSNALKFTPPQGQIHIDLDRVDQEMRISISDSGAGIRAELLPHVFERFTQDDSSPRRRHGGLGIGLAIVRHIVELHGGTVRAFSAGQGMGSTFVVTLPLVGADLHRKANDSPAGLRQAADLSGLHVLVVDDDRDARELTGRILQRAGARVMLAASAMEALRMLRQTPPDLMISDIGMPDMDGYELLRHLRALTSDPASRLPAVALTAFARDEDRNRAMMSGYAAHLAKPVRPADLLATVAAVSGRIASA